MRYSIVALVLGVVTAALTACDSGAPEPPGPPEPTGPLLEAELAPADPEATGYTISLSGDRALLGAPYSGDGAAYVFVRSRAGWVQEARLTHDGSRGNFGASVSLSGDRALVSDPGEREGPVAYVYARTGDGWVREATLDPGLPRTSQFGTSVSLSGDRALVGAWWDHPQGLGSGAAYVFVRSETGWTQEAVLTSENRRWHDYFGRAVSLSGDRALIGAPNRRRSGGAEGAVFAFARTGGEWVQEAELAVDLPGEYDEFGTAVSLSGDRALVGAQFINAEGTTEPVMPGAAYVFTRTGNGWSQEAELTVDGAYLDEQEVSLSGEQALVRDQFGTAAYWFVRAGGRWVVKDTLAVRGDARFGAISFSGDRALIGASDSGGAGALVFSGLGPSPY